MLDDTIRWSSTSSKLIGTGEEPSSGAPLDEDTAAASTPSAEPRRTEGRAAPLPRGNGLRPFIAPS